ncbi:MAG: DUF2927 domain-containing protein [Saprospiraceae bacterium]
MRLLTLSFLLLLCGTSCRSTLPAWKQNALVNLPERDQYFCEVALSSEFGRKYNKIRKWQQPINLYLTGTEVPHLDRELDKIITELNDLVPTLSIARVFESEAANLTIFLGKGIDFARQFRPAKTQVEYNWGLVFIKYNLQGKIKRGQVYVDVFRATDKVAQRHLLREELTQALGLLNDSQQFPDSIFYQEWTLTTAYSELDKWLIERLYEDDLKAGMKFKKVIEQLENKE